MESHDAAYSGEDVKVLKTAFVIKMPLRVSELSEGGIQTLKSASKVGLFWHRYVARL